MSKLKWAFPAVLALLGVSQVFGGEFASDPRGTWVTEAGDARVHVTKCGEALCGTIVWLKQPIDPATGKPQVDDKNPDPALARRPIIGLNLFLNMKPHGDHWSGRIYNADNGKTYSSDVSVIDDKTLKVAGCVLFFCGSESWSRVAETEKLASREH
jgi:uncharacterized protein (DUF2147 family)